MKTVFFLAIAMGMTVLSSLAQVPEQMKYQAVARDNGGNVISMQLISFRISILQGSAAGTSVYSETHSITTNDFGLANLTIGNGTIVSGNFSSIDWSSDPYFLQVEMDEAGGSVFQIMGTSQLLSVPYALHSKTADSITNIDNFSWSITGNEGTDPTTNFIGTTDDQPLIFKVNNVQAGKIYGGNTFYGKNAGVWNSSGTENTATGAGSLYFNSTGNGNTAYGHDALGYNSAGNSNTATGSNALFSNTSGNNNTANGFASLNINTTGSYNTAVGIQSLYYNTIGHRNTAIGVFSLLSNVSGNSNTGIGQSSLYENTSGTENTASGYNSLRDNTIGDNNTASGAYSLLNNTTGSDNTAIGYNSMVKNTTAENNTAIGAKSMTWNTSGSSNTAGGSQSLNWNSTGYENTAFGTRALYNNSTAGRNVAVGYEAAHNVTTGFYNTALGWGSGPSIGSSKNSTAIGRGATTTAWNQIRLGNNIVTSIGGYTGWSNISDKRFKKAIKDDIVGLDFIMALQPVSYQLDMDMLEEITGNNRHSSDSSYRETIEEQEFNTQSKIEKGQIRQSGFLAQDVELAAESVGYNFSGVDKPKNENDFYGLRYAEFVVPLVKALQEQQAIIEQQNANYENLLQRIEQLEKLTGQ